MSSRTVKQAFNAYLDSVWTATPILPVENVYVDQPPDEEWLTVQYPSASVTNQALGNRCWREQGAIIIGLIGVSGKGTDALDTLWETMLPLMMGEDISGVQVEAMTTPSYGFGEWQQETSGNAYRYQFTVEYYFDRNN